jgi:anti-sigma factor RsiW
MADPTLRISRKDMADICALADGTLPVDRRPEVEARVAASEEMREALRHQRRALAAAEVLRSEPVPEALPPAVLASRDRASRRRPRRRVFVRRLLPVAGVAVAAAVAVLVIGGTNGQPAIADVARLAARPPTASAPAAASGARLAVSVEGTAFPDWRRFGWQATGVRRARLDGRSTTVVHYRNGDMRIAYAIVSGDALPLPSSGSTTVRAGVPLRALSVGGRATVTWQRNGHTCVLTGSAPRRALLALASWRGRGELVY